MAAANRRQVAITVALVVIGWGVGLPIYLFSAADSAVPLGASTDSKRYLDQLERVGGASSVVSEELGQKFSSLFHGDTLGLTLGVIGTLAAILYFTVIRHLEPGPSP